MIGRKDLARRNQLSGIAELVAMMIAGEGTGRGIYYIRTSMGLSWRYSSGTGSSIARSMTHRRELVRIYEEAIP